MSDSLAVCENGQLWSATKVAEVLGLSRACVWRWARQGRLPEAVEIIGADWNLVWRSEDIIAFAKRQGLPL